MRYLQWLMAIGCVGAAIYLGSAGEGDLTLLGWVLAALGWGLAGILAGQVEGILDAWKRIDRQRR
jgi:hypothetical protein